ncbi:FMN-binding protein [Actinoplanes sp. TRM 88003]|uniref:FMN-binding protein n=1 Tax=Paractinoplanes aksuensis TaxID=2939490 RepID=A0ABT1DIU3_9ACTN|nr:FMN-binding protein [Actinoplanes aksuensis]MCO8270747.1 FMN-binding protein [Actinoplanes aksuensis]
MRRSTAAAVGTLTGAALIIGVRLSVTPPEAPVVAAPVGNLADATPAPKPSSKKPAASGDKEGDKEKAPEKEEEAAKPKSGLKDGVFKGNAAANPYGKIQVTIKVEGGEITDAAATYPTANDSATINPPAIAALKQSTLDAQNADVSAVSGATYTSESYVKSLQAALDAAKA